MKKYLKLLLEDDLIQRVLVILMIILAFIPGLFMDFPEDIFYFLLAYIAFNTKGDNK